MARIYIKTQRWWQARQPRVLALAGKQFGRLLVLRDTGFRIKHSSWWLVQCVCGRKKIVRGHDIVRGNTVSCGCKRLGPQSHGGKSRNTPPGIKRAYVSYHSMLTRCTNPNRVEWPYYGGRGIKIAKRWQGKNGFANFLADMGERPLGKTLDRRNFNGNYTPSNCRWATREVQNQNRRGCTPPPEVPSIMAKDFAQRAAQMESDGW